MTDEALKENTTHGKAERACKQCGAAFVASHHRSVYCTTQCHKNRNAKVRRDERALSVTADRPCDWCGEAYTPKTPRQKYCQRLCLKRRESQIMSIARPGVMKECAVCKKEYRAFASALTCSKKCSKQRHKAAVRRWDSDNMDVKIASMKRWRSDNPEKVRAAEKRRNAKPVRAMHNRISRNMRNTLQRVGSVKSSTFTMLGYTPQDLADHLERQFAKGMTWDNRHKWHIDHIVPISTAETEADVIALNQLSNLRPIWAKDNLAKSDKRTHLI